MDKKKKKKKWIISKCCSETLERFIRVQPLSTRAQHVKQALALREERKEKN